eukprot:173965_1
MKSIILLSHIAALLCSIGDFILNGTTSIVLQIYKTVIAFSNYNKQYSNNLMVNNKINSDNISLAIFISIWQYFILTIQTCVQIAVNIMSKYIGFILVSYLCFIGAINALPFEFNVIPHLTGHECIGQLKDLGPFAGGVEQCAAAAYTDSSCVGDKIMWSDSYSTHSPSWGCRCCAVGFVVVAQSHWDIYQFVRYTIERPK